MNAWWSWGWQSIPSLQSLGTAWTEAMRIVSQLGTEAFYMLVLPAVLWCYDASLGLRLGFILLGSAWFNSALKLVAGLPRPYWFTQEVQALQAETSYGLPSGHAQTPLALYGRIAAHARRRWLTLAIAAAILLLGLSRLSLGVHFPADVLTGWVIGGLLLAAFLRFEPPVASWFRRQPVNLQLLVLLLLSIGMMVGGWFLVEAASDRMLPQDWVMNAMRAEPHDVPLEPRDFKDLLDPAATFLGLGIGGVLLVEWGGFDAGGGGAKRWGRFAFGLVGVLALYYGLRAVFPGSESPAGLAFRVLRYALVGFWVSYGAPRVFVWARLA
jgi:membrane-associated phospholipid phosphatase